ncbi:exocyst complex component Sec6 [Ancylostoma ceylanicum]|uniref:Exocyst complex component Sec6 n=1 Tax=Ancylostoma ceylanicum TaxID=53326 RepID=A0A0D6M6M3_9BILA|nr:exocyst complex component Sec6 [Ancylostoma ceylanicum]
MMMKNLERLYEQWEENDDEKLDDDELPEHKRSPKPLDLDSIKAKAKNPEELLIMTKKGQTLMMFVNIRDPSNPQEKNRTFTMKYTEIFQSMLRNNHIICEVFPIDDDRAIFMFNDGAQAFEAKDFLVKQIQVTEVTLEGQQYVGAGAAKKDELYIAAIRHRLTPFPQLREKMRGLRDANARHGQYAAAMENLKHIFNINQTIYDTKVALDQGKLLAAHKNIMDLELARDELLFEVHKSDSSNKDYEKNLLITFFIKVDELVTDLSSNMWFVIGRALEMVKGSETGSGPQELVSCIRIVEREERIDNYYLEKKSRGSAFMPPGRPRQWRKKTFEVMRYSAIVTVLEKTVWSRVEGNQLEDRSLNKAWLARYLEVCRKVIVDDLQLARAAVPCFPPDYQIYDRFVHMYHNCVCKRLREIAAERLEKSELVQLLSWIQTYGFVEMTRNDMKIWLEKTLSAEKDDWNKHVRPDEDNFGYFYTSLPNIMFGMLRDTVTLAKEVSVEVIPNVINLTIEEFFIFANNYKDAFTDYRNKYFENRSKFREFTSTMIAIANNLQTCIESTDKYMQQVRLSMENDEQQDSGVAGRRSVGRQQIIDNIERLNNRWSKAVSVALVGCSAPETICMTVQDYYADHRHLRPATRCALLMDLQFRIVGEYLKAIDSRRLTFATYEERAAAGSRMKADAVRLEALFQQLRDTEDISEPFTLVTSLIASCGDVLSLRDKSLLTLEVTTFSRKCPNIPKDLLAALLACRDDVSRSEAKSMAEDVMNHVQLYPKDRVFGQLFASVLDRNDSSWKPNLDMVNMLSSFMRRDSPQS